MKICIRVFGFCRTWPSYNDLSDYIGDYNDDNDDHYVIDLRMTLIRIEDFYFALHALS